MKQLFDNWSVELGVLTATAYAMVLGGVIGFEREMKDRPAGFRTHMLVAGAAALLVGLADLLAVRYSGEHYRELARVAPLRLIEAVVARSEAHTSDIQSLMCISFAVISLKKKTTLHSLTL